MIVRIDGEEVGRRIAALSGHLSASTPQALMLRVCSHLLGGPPDSKVVVHLRKPNGELREARLTRRVPPRERPAEREGEMVRVLEG